MPVRGKITAAAVAIGGMLATGGGSAIAQTEPGLTVDPQSPAGVEYAVPLDSGRGHGGGSGHPGGATGSSGSSKGNPALFGSGITPAGKGSPAAGGKHSGSRTHRSGTKRSSAADAGAGGTPVRAAASYGSTAPVVGLIAAILAAGGGLGVFVRFRSRRGLKDQPRP